MTPAFRILVIGIALSVGLAAAAFSQTQTVAVSAFDAIEASNGIHVVVTVGEPHAVVIEGPAGEASQVYVHVNRGRLIVRPRLRRPHRGSDLSGSVVHVTAPELASIEVENGAELTATGVSASYIELEATNGGVLRIDGTCGRADVVARRGGIIEAGDLVCREVKARASMGGEMEVNAEESLDAGAGMGGVIEARGAPRHVERSSSFGGTIDVG